MTATNTVLQRKLANARGDSGGSGRSALWALRRALAKAADEVADLSLAVIGATQSRVTRDALADMVGADVLPLLLDGPEGARGALWLDRPAVGALVEQQTTGRISGSVAQDRSFTATDAALVAPLVDAALSQAGDLVETAADQDALRGFRFGARAEDAAALVLAVEAERLRLYELTLDFDRGAAQGRMVLVLPEPGTRPTTAAEAPPQRRTLSTRACDSLRAELSATICRMRLPLSALAALEPGDLLELKDERLEETELLTISGLCAATGQLGQAGGFRAVRLSVWTPQKAAPKPAPAFTVAKPPPRRAGPEETADEDALPPVLADVDEFRIDNMPSEQAAQEISQLAGLPMDNDPWPVPAATVSPTGKEGDG